MRECCLQGVCDGLDHSVVFYEKFGFAGRWQGGEKELQLGRSTSRQSAGDRVEFTMVGPCLSTVGALTGAHPITDN